MSERGQISGINVDHARDVTLQAGGDIIAGNKTTINNIIQRIAKELTTTPYKFLASYELADRDIFYGRDRIIEELAAQAGRQKVILVNGASGSGKSSLVNAGLIPRVADNGYSFMSFREYSDPLAQLREKLSVGRDAAEELYSPDDPRSLLGLVRAFNSFPLVIVLDQFERFFVRVDVATRTAFIGAFRHCLQHSDAKELCFVMVFRREFLGQLTTEFEQQMPEFLNELYRINLLPLHKAEAREAILRPLEQSSLKIGYQTEFVDEVLLAGLAEQASGTDTIDPPHLQIVCNQLFEAARQRLQISGIVLIDRRLYDELGGAENILNTYLDKVVEGVAQDPERIALVHSILKTMVDAGTNTRTFIALDEFRRNLPDVNESEILRFIEKLLEARVVEERSARYSLSHEHMVGKVKEWFDPRELERKRAEETLGRGMAEWKNSAALLGRVQVERIRKWLPEPTADEQALLQASEQKYLEDEHREAGWRRLKRLSLYGAGAFTTLVIILGVYSWVQKLGAERATALAVSRQWAAQAHTDLDLHAPRDLLLALNSVALARRIGAFNPIEARQLLDDVLNSAGGVPLHHSGPVTAIGVSPDGHSLAAASGGEIRIWDMAAPARPARLLSSPGKVAALAFSPDGHALATVGDDSILRLWPMEAADPAGAVRLLQRHGGPIANVAYSPSGRWIATVSMDGTARLWDPSSTDPAATSIVLPHEEQASVRTLAFSPDEHWLATASWHDRNGGMLRLWDLRSSDPAERSVRIPLQAGTDIHSLAFSPNNEWLAAGATETYNVLLLKVAAPDTRFSMHVDQWVERLAFSPDGHWLAAPSHYTALLWDLTKADPSQAPLVLRGHKDQIVDLAFAPGGSLFATASWDRTVQIWDVADRFTLSAVLRGHEGPLSGLSFSSDARHLATASEDGNVRLWDASSPTAEPLILTANKGTNNLHMWNLRSAGSHIALRLLQDQLDPFAGTVFSPDGKWLATVSRRGTFIHLWNVAVPTPKRYDLPIRNDYLVTPDFSSDGRWLATPAADGVGIVLWNLQQPNPIANGKLLRGHRDVVRSLAFSADGHRLISGANDGLAIVWDVTAENPSANQRRLSGANSLVRSVAISGDGRWAIAGSWEPNPVARIWDLSAAATPEPIVLPFHDRVYDVAVSPNGHWAAAASWDHTSQVIDLTTPGAKPIVLRGHTARTLSVAFSPDSRWLATGNEDRTARLWDLTAADPAAESVILRSEGEVGNVAFSPDGRWLALGGTEIRARPFSPDGVWFASNDADARLYRPRLQDLTELACQTAGRNLLQNEIRSSEVPLDQAICSK